MGLVVRGRRWEQKTTPFTRLQGVPPSRSDSELVCVSLDEATE